MIYRIVYKLENSDPPTKNWIVLQEKETDQLSGYIITKWKDQTVCHKVTVSMMIIPVQKQKFEHLPNTNHY